MKFTFSLKPGMTFSVIFFFILHSACHHRFSETEMAAAQVIRITDGDEISGKLTMIDVNDRSADTFNISPGAIMQWQLQTPKIMKITDIKAKADNPNVFSRGPRQHGSSDNWGGKISDEAGGEAENYYIDWTDSKGGNHTYDPRIQVNSK